VQRAQTDQGHSKEVKRLLILPLPQPTPHEHQHWRAYGPTMGIAGFGDSIEDWVRLFDFSLLMSIRENWWHSATILPRNPGGYQPNIRTLQMRLFRGVQHGFIMIL
jgi:hypothetical protein